MNRQKIQIGVLAVYAAALASLWAFLSLDGVADLTARLIAYGLKMLTDFSADTIGITIGGIVGSLLLNGLFGLLAYFALRKRLLIQAILCTAAEIALFLAFMSTRFTVPFFFGSSYLAAALCLLFVRLRRRFPTLLGREMISYVFFGALTTFVNIALAVGSYRLLLTMTASVAANLLSNVIAWTGAVLFAYAVNRRFVFQSRTRGKAAVREFGLFITARLFSFVIDAAGMVILVDFLPCPYGLAKIAMNVVVLILNYIFSKLVIFRKV